MIDCGYHHTQRGIIQPILLAVAVVFVATACVVRGAPPLRPAFLAAAMVFVLLLFALGTLTVRDDGDRLAVRFGPLPLFKKTIPYADMTDVERDRSTFLAGWGIHRTRRGWLWNVGGFDCVRIAMGERSTLVGTDDPDGLVAFLRSKLDVGGKEDVG